jgi:hypothetical protein
VRVIACAAPVSPIISLTRAGQVPGVRHELPQSRERPGVRAVAEKDTTDPPRARPPAEPPPVLPPAEPPPQPSGVRWRVPEHLVPVCGNCLSELEIAAVERAVRVAHRFRRVLRPAARRHRTGEVTVSKVQKLLMRASAVAAETFGMRAAQVISFRTY